MYDRRQLQEAYGEWLDTFEWHLFTTLTFRKTPSSRTSINHFRRFARHLERLAPGGIGYFVGSETGGDYGREHLHALIRVAPDPNSDCIHSHGERVHSLIHPSWKWWFNAYGRALILPFERDKGATHYVTKYVTKTLADWDIGGNLADYVRKPETNRTST